MLPPNRRVVLLDTNALFLPIRSGFPLEAEIDRLVPGARVIIALSSLRELDRLVERATPGATGARALAEKFGTAAVRSRGDDGVVEAAVRERAMVVTADRLLQARLRSRGIFVLAPRDRHRLDIRPPGARHVARRPSVSKPARRPARRIARAR